MRRIALWASSTVAALVLLFGYHTSTSGVAAVPGVATTQEPIGTSTSTSPASPSSTGTATTASATVTGDVVQTQWGPVQVQITTDGSGTITDVEVIQYPSGNHEDEQINSYALPQLVQETLDAQSADIDMVSGATVTSEGYLQSLQSALDQATA